MPKFNPKGGVYQDPVLTRIATRFQNQNYVWNRIFPTFPVSKMSGIYYEHVPRHLNVPKTERAIGGPANEVEHEYIERSFRTKPYALKDIIAFEEQDQTDNPLSPLQDATESIVDRLMLGAEQRAVDLLKANVPSEELTGTDRWGDYDNSDPIGDVFDKKTEIHKKVLRDPNVMVIGKEGWNTLVNHPDIIERIKHSQLGVATTQLVAQLFQIDEIVVADAGITTLNEANLIDDSGNENVLADPSIDYLWKNDVYLAYIDPANRRKTVTFGRTFSYQDRIATRWDDQDRRGTFTRVEWNYAQHIVSKNAAFRLENAVATA